MKIKRKLNVSSDAYFTTLQRYLLNDLRKNVDRKLKLNDLKVGYQFTKVYKRKNAEDYVSSQVIEEMDFAKAYCLRFSIPNGFQIISHHIKEVDGNTIEVTYEEVIETKKLGLSFQQFMRRGKSRKLMNQILKKLEIEIQSKSTQ